MSKPASVHSVTRWIAELKEGDAEAARRLWDRYYQQIATIARRKLGPVPGRVADEEDVAVSVFDSLFRGAAEGQFNQLSDRTDLWQMLVAITTNKAVDCVRRATRQKRGGGQVRGESVFEPQVARGGQGFDQFPADKLDPDLQVLLEEEHSRLMALLRDDTLRQIVAWRIEGLTNVEIARQLGVSEHTVGRKLRLIQRQWSAELTT